MPRVIFHANRAESDNEPAGRRGRADGFVDRCEDRSLARWSCTSQSEAGDLYLFWFSAPVDAILGIGRVKDACTTDRRSRCSERHRS